MCIGAQKSSPAPVVAAPIKKEAPKLVAKDTEAPEARRRRGKKTLVTDAGVNTSGNNAGLNIPV